MTTLTTTIGQIVRGDREVFPPYLYAAYQSTKLRAPLLPLVEVPLTLSELTGPGPVISRVTPEDADMTRNAGTGGEAEVGRPIPNTLIEIWQANAAGRYLHTNDTWPGPLDPNFLGIGRTLTDANGVYRFLTVRPGIYPWKNHRNAWRPAHIHFSLFGRSLVSRLVTQMYFPDDPMLAIDPIFHGVPNDAARQRMVSAYDHDVTEEEWALGYRWDIVLHGPEATPFDERWPAPIENGQENGR
jgi:protocatechuate 3,4-dioxygenase beta subunit